MKKLTMTMAMIGLIAAGSAMADDQQLQQRVAQQRAQVQTIMKTKEGCDMMCEEMIKHKGGRESMIETMLKDEATVKELKSRLK